MLQTFCRTRMGSEEGWYHTSAVTGESLQEFLQGHLEPNLGMGNQVINRLLNGNGLLTEVHATTVENPPVLLDR